MFSPPFHFETATADDFEWYYALRKRTMFGHFAKAGINWDEDDQRRWHREGFNPDTLRIICNGSSRIGCINVAKNDTELHVNAFCIEPDYQGQGLGTKILEQILAEPEHTTLPCTLDVLINNPANKLYERLGFEKTDGPLPILVYYVRWPSRLTPSP